MAQMAQRGTEPCNTESRARYWFGTWNNYPMDGVAQIKSLEPEKFVIGKEVGKQGTPHLQFCISFKNPKRFGGMKADLPEVHWEVCKKWNAAVEYCKKEGNFETNIINGKKVSNIEMKLAEYMEKKYKDIVWKPWQQNVLDILKTAPDDRTVYWFWEETGNVGKSFLAKYIVWKYKCVIINGKQADIFNGIKSFLEAKDDFPDVVIVDIPRTHQNYVCYSSIEKIKDGLFYSGKYEGGQILLIPPHIIVFANFPPEATTMSLDRWKVVNL